MNETLQIDPSQLDEEWLQQPLLFDQAVTGAADCQEIVDNLRDERTALKEKLDWLEADRANFLRKDFVNEGFAKPPGVEPVKDWVAKRPEVEVLKTEIHEKQVAVSEAENKLLRATNTIKSVQEKGKALENLCKLHGLQYFAVPNPGHMLDGGKRFIEAKNQKVEEQSKEATTALNEKKTERKTKTEPEAPPSRPRRKRR